MKKYLIIFLLFPALCFAGSIQGWHSRIAKSRVAAGGADSCTGGLIHSWHCESGSDTDITSDGLSCSTQDTSATLSGTSIDTGGTPTPVDESGTLNFAAGDGNYDRARFDGTANLVDEGKVTGYFWVDSGGFAASDTIFTAKNATTSHYLKVRLAGSSTDISLDIHRWVGGHYFSSSITTTNGNLGEGEWVYFEAEWKAGVGGNDTYLKVCNSDKSVCDPLTESKNWAAQSGTLSYFEFGYADGANIDGWMDNVKVYDTSQF